MIFISNILGPRKVQHMHTSTSDNTQNDNNRPESPQSATNDAKQSSQTSLTVFPYSKSKDVVTIAPFASLEPGDTIPSHAIATRPTAIQNLTDPFGPVTAVLDPRIKAVHRRVFCCMLVFGMSVMVVSFLHVFKSFQVNFGRWFQVSSAIILSIPGRCRL
jgi:hypothetical protein